MKHESNPPGVSRFSSCSSSVSSGGIGSGSGGKTLWCCLSPPRRSRTMVSAATPGLQRASMVVAVLLLWACRKAAMVHAAAVPRRTATSTSTMAALRLERVDTLVYEKGGTIRSIDWYLDEQLGDTNHSTTALHNHYNLQLVAATSLSMIQVWNQTISSASVAASTNPNRHHNILDRHRSSRSLVEHENNWTLHDVIVNASLSKDKHIRCIAHSPVGNRAATAGDDGLIRIYRTTNDNDDFNDSWTVIYTLDVMVASNNLTNSNSNNSSGSSGIASSSIRSLAWHPTGRFFAVAGDNGKIECAVWNTITWKAVPLPKPLASTTSTSWTATTASSDTTAASTPSQHVDWSPSGNQLMCGHVILTLFDDSTNSTTGTASTTTTTTSTGSALNNDTDDTLLKPPFVHSTSNNGTSSSPLSRDTAVLDTCLLCGLSTWSPDGKFIATAYGNQVHILNGAPAVIVLATQPPSFESSATNLTLASPTTATTATNISLDEAAYAQHQMVLQGGLLHNLTVPTDRERAYVMIQALAWSADARYLAVGAMGQAYIWVYDATNWTHVPQRVETALGFGIEALAWRPLVPSSSVTENDDTNSSSASTTGTTEPVQYTQQLAVGTGRVIEIWNVHPQVHNESNNVTSVQPDMTAAPSNVEAPIAAPSAPTAITTTPTSTPNLALEETASGPLTTGTATSRSNTERAASFNVATMSGISIAATIVAVGCAAVLFAWRLRVVARNVKRRPHAVPALPPVLLQQHAGDDSPNDTNDQEDGNQAQNKHHKKDKRSHGHAAKLVEPQEDLTGDSTDGADDEHFNRIIAIPCSDTMDSSDKSASGAASDLLWVGRIQH